MLYIIALILLALFVTTTCYMGYRTNQLDVKITVEDAENRLQNPK